MKRVGIIALLQESNTFLNEPTTLAHFEQELLLKGPAIRERMQGTHHELGGFFAGLDQHGIEAVPIFAARAMPFGVVTPEAFDSLMAMMRDAVQRTGEIDGLLVAPHGATVSRNVPDVDGHWLTMLRKHFGPVLPIIGTLDPHCNLSPAMVAACDALTAYRTNPHVDQRQRGLEAADLMARTLASEIRPVQAAAFPPLAINIECQDTATPPCLPLYQSAEAIRARPKVLSASICLGFPYADVPEMGAATLVVADGDRALAQELAGQLATEMWNSRHTFRPRLVSIDQALDDAERIDRATCLLDMGDNVGGGSPGDGTHLAHAIHQRGMANSFVCLCDPQAVKQALEAGVGARLQLAVGGKADRRHGEPLRAEFAVIAQSDGRFREAQARHGGFSAFDQGPTAVLRTDRGLTVMLTTLRMVPFSLQQLEHCGLDPRSFRRLVAKGVHAPVAAYREVCRHFIRVNTPGVTSADLSQFQYAHRRRSMFPFEPDTTWDGGENTINTQKS